MQKFSTVRPNAITKCYELCSLSIFIDPTIHDVAVKPKFFYWEKELTRICLSFALLLRYLNNTDVSVSKIDHISRQLWGW